MKIYTNLNDFKEEKTSIATGFFDGVHLGHQKILNCLKEKAQASNSQSVVLTFTPHPREIINSQYELERLTTLDEKIQLIKKHGIQHLVLLPFNEEILKISSFNFIQNILIKEMNISQLIIGHNHRFGNTITNDFNYIKEYSKQKNFLLYHVKAENFETKNISSSEIRNFLHKGKIEKANYFLGYNYFISGNVVGGSQIGRSIGFPTANIEIGTSTKLIPKNGVYAVWVEIANNHYQAMLNIGNRPTIGNDLKRTIEVNIFDFDRNIYNESIKLKFVKKLRDEKKFNGIDELKKQLIFDKQQTIKTLKENAKNS